jgi:acyl-CoA synthetase (AMP-forming)/AMP-acid ligase II
MESPLEPSAQTIPGVVQIAAERFGARHAIEDGDVTLTFAELAEAGMRAARAFVAAGITAGDRVAIWAPNIHEWILAAIGLQSAGGVLVPLNTRLKGAEAGYILRKSGARILCTVEEFVGNRYVELLRAALGGPARDRPVAELPALERVVIFRQPPPRPLLGKEGGSLSLADTVDRVETMVPRQVPGDESPGSVDQSRLKHVLSTVEGPTANAVWESPSGDFSPTQPGNSFPGVELPAAFARQSTDSPEKEQWGGCVVSWPKFITTGDTVSVAQAQQRAAAVSPDDLSDILFTSGTTGKPKGVMTTHGQNVRAFTAWSEVVGLREGDRYLIVNPFFHSFGYKAGWLAALIRGATILPHQVFDVAAVLDRIGRERVTVLPGPPTLYQSILAHPDREKLDLSALRLAVTGAAVIPVELIYRMRQDLTFETIITGYGLTESSGVVTMCRYDDDPETIATTSGRAIPDVEVRCVDNSGAEVPRGQPGEVVVRGYNVMKGYFDDAAATAEAIDAAGWLHTGDIGVMDERGYLRITDRIKDMFITGGFNCYPAEIENILLTHEAIAQVAVIGVPDERMGEVGMAFVVPRPGATVTTKSIVAWGREHMANYKVPRFVEVVDALPMNASGKVTKFVLRERARMVS